jgi:hypothetical protein
MMIDEQLILLALNIMIVAPRITNDTWTIKILMMLFV